MNWRRASAQTPFRRAMVALAMATGAAFLIHAPLLLRAPQYIASEVALDGDASLWDAPLLKTPDETVGANYSASDLDTSVRNVLIRSLLHAQLGLAEGSLAAVRAVSLLLMMVVGMLAWWWLRRQGLRQAPSLAGMVLLMVAARGLESVALPSGQAELGCVAFSLAALHLWRCWRDRGGVWAPTASALCLTAALALSPAALATPLMLAVLWRMEYRAEDVGIPTAAGLFFAGSVMTLAAFWAASWHVIGADQGVLAGLSLVERIPTAIMSAWWQFWRFIWPGMVPLSDEPIALNPAHWLSVTTWALLLTGLLATVSLKLYWWRRNSRVAAAALIALLATLPSTQLFWTTPELGRPAAVFMFVAAMAWCVAEMLEYLWARHAGGIHRAAWGVVGGLILLNAVLSFQGSFAFADNRTYLRHLAKSSPESLTVRAGYGFSLLSEEGKAGAAERVFRECLALRAEPWPGCRRGLAEALRLQKRPREALALALAAAEAAPTDRRSALELARIEADSGAVEEGRRRLKELLARDRNDCGALREYGRQSLLHRPADAQTLAEARDGYRGALGCVQAGPVFIRETEVQLSRGLHRFMQQADDPDLADPVATFFELLTDETARWDLNLHLALYRRDCAEAQRLADRRRPSFMDLRQLLYHRCLSPEYPPPPDEWTFTP